MEEIRITAETRLRAKWALVVVAAGILRQYGADTAADAIMERARARDFEGATVQSWRIAGQDELVDVGRRECLEADRRAAVEAAGGEENLCPTTGEPADDCTFCTGEACNKCGAGCWDGSVENCEHAPDERHHDLP